MARHREAAIRIAPLIETALPALLATRAAALARAERQIPDPHALIAARKAGLDRAALRLDGAVRGELSRQRQAAARVVPHLSIAGVVARLRARRGQLDVHGARLDGASYERVLARGFALVRNARGQAVTGAAAVKPGARLRLRFADGEVGVVSEGRQSVLPF